MANINAYKWINNYKDAILMSQDEK